MYPPRCVLAASSPVLASILLSAGALVELQDPCLSDAVLASLLDYIYTGVLPCSLSQQQYFRLLTAACHLQMKELQEALSAARRRIITEEHGSASNGADSFKDINDADKTDRKTSSDRSSSPKNECFRRLETNTEYSSEVATFEEAQMNPTSCKIDNKWSLDDNEPNHHTRADANTLNTFCVIKSSESVNTSDESKVICSKQQNLMLNNPNSTEVHDIPGVNQGVHEYQCHSDGFAQLKICQGSTKEEPLRTSRLKRRSSSTSQHLYGAVPVICHSSGAAVQPPVSSSRALVSLSSSTDSDNTIKGATTEHQDQDGRHNQDNKNHSLCIHPELKDNSSTTDGFNTGSTGHNGQRHRDCPQNNTSLALQNEDRSKGVKRHMESDFDRFFSKHQRLDCSQCHNESLKTAKEEQAEDVRSVVSLPAQGSEAGSDFHCEKRLDVEAKQEHISVRLLAQTDTEDSNRKPHRNPNSAISVRYKYKSNSTSTSSESGLDDVFASECCTSSESQELSSSKTTESCSSPMAPAENCMSDPTRETTGQPYHEHLHYQYLPHQDTHSLIQDSHCKHSQHSHTYSLDGSTDEEEAGALDMKQHISTEKTNQVLVLDVISKPVALPCKHKSVTEEEWVIKSNKKSSVSRVEGFDETHKQRKDGERNSSDEDQCGTEAQAAQKPAIMDVSKTTTCPVCPTPTVRDSEQTSHPSTLSSCVPSSLLASMPGERSACPQPFQCSLCDRSFSQRGSLNRHVRSHLGVRPFPCPCCPMTFSRQYRVTEHMRVHQRCTLGNGFHKPMDSSSKDIEERNQHVSY